VYELSFSSTVKNELCRINIGDSSSFICELAAAIRISGLIRVVSPDEINMRIITENAAFARRIFSLVKELYGINMEMSIRRRRKLKKHIVYMLVLTCSKGLRKVLNDVNIKTSDTVEYLPYAKMINRKSGRKAYLRGAFLASGSMSDPEKTYHLEIICQNQALAKELNEIMDSFSLNAKVIMRKGSHVVYLKEGENIVDFLNIIGAHSALLKLENIRILKEMRNNVNRIVNCETANLQKTVNASVRQVDNIRYIQDNLGFEKLPENLRDIAQLRLKYSDASLKELGEMLSPTLGKSGVNHRLRKLDIIAEKIRSMKGE
jgi:DNA-binding protein WhiA